MGYHFIFQSVFNLMKEKFTNDTLRKQIFTLRPLNPSLQGKILIDGLLIGYS
jgi:hypothetical protein